MNKNNPQEYLDSLLQEIETTKAKGGSGIFKIREKLTDRVAMYAKRYLEDNTPYRVDIRKCPACAFEWDIVIIF